MAAKSQKKILVLSTFPIAQALHGGQKRVQAVIQEYRQQFAEVRSVAVFSRWANPKHGRWDIPVSHATDRIIQESGRVEDILCGEAIYSEPRVKDYMANLLRTFKPDVIQLEQIYPYIGLAPLLGELGLHPAIVYDAHNIEYEMKKSIYESSSLTRSEAQKLVERLKELETNLVKDAVLTAAVSQDDQAGLTKLGARKTIFAPNGIYPLRPTHAATNAWKEKFAQDNVRQTFLYVSSAHLPNWTSFLDMVGDGLGFVPPDAKILLAGGLSYWLTTRYKWQSTPGAATFWLRAEALGILPQDRLDGLINAADRLLLPITTGGGSNLKTAEALLSGKPIIGTSRAFRAYEEFKNLPTVTIADTPEDFRAAMVRSLSAPQSSLSTSEQTKLHATVTWSHTLKQLTEEVKAL